MNKVSIGIVIILAAGVVCSAQDRKASPNDEPQVVNNRGGKNKRSESVGQPGASAMANVAAQLQGSIDVQKANVGDEVVLKTTKAIKQNGETVIPKGSNLIGRITEVKQRSKENSVSRIGMVFDRIEGKNLDAPITASILSITNVQAISTVGDSFGSDITGSSQSSGSVSRGNSGSSGGGGGLLGGVGSSVGGVVGSTTQAVGGIANTATQTVGNVAGTATHAAGTVGRTVNGIQISNSVTGSANGTTTLSSPNKNFKLEKGLMFQMQVDNQAGN